MALPTHYTGSDGEILIDGVPFSLVNFNLSIAVGVINSAVIGKVSDRHFSGKKEITGTITQVVVNPSLIQMLLGDGVDSVISNLLAATPLTGSRAEIAITSSPPSGPSAVSVTLAVGDDASGAGSMVIHGTNAANKYVSEVLHFTAMATTDVPQIVRGLQIFKTTTFVDVEAALDGEVSGTHSTVTIDGVGGQMTITPGPSTLFDIVGKVTNVATGAIYQVEAVDCFFTGGELPIGDSETIVQTDLPFVMYDADVGLTIIGSTS